MHLHKLMGLHLQDLCHYYLYMSFCCPWDSFLGQEKLERHCGSKTDNKKYFVGAQYFKKWKSIYIRELENFRLQKCLECSALGCAELAPLSVACCLDVHMKTPQYLFFKCTDPI